MKKEHLLIMVAFIIIILILIPIFALKSGKDNTKNFSKSESLPSEEQQKTEEVHLQETPVAQPNEYNSQPQAKQISNNYNKIAENLYFNIQSFFVSGDVTQGVFTEYLPQKNSIAKYKIIQLDAYCDTYADNGLKQIKLPLYKYYDANGNFLNEEKPNIPTQQEQTQENLDRYSADVIENGNLFFNTLCETH